MTDVLEVTDLRKVYDGIVAVDGVSFTVREGEILGVIGPNGSGKSTLFNCILGQARPSAGAVVLDGHPVTSMRPCELSRRGVGRTFQMLQLFPALSARENLVLAGQEHQGSMLERLLGRRDIGMSAAVDRMIDLFQLDRVADQPAGALSFGEQRLVDVAMAFMAGSRLVLLDEPASGVNPATLADLRDRLRALGDERKATFVIIEHNMEFVMSLCARVLVLAEGRIIAEGAPAAIRHDPKVIEAYLGS